MNRLDVFCFVSVARTQSFSLTARELMISQQAVSRHIRSLEEEVGYPLFLRNYQNVVLTKAGAKMLAYFSKRDQLLEDFKKNNRLMSQDNTLKIAWSQWLSCPDWFRNSIGKFQKQNPDIKILLYNLNSQEMADAQISEGLDFILTTRYSARYLPVYWNQTIAKEVPLYIISSGERHLDQEHKVWIADTGDSNELSVKGRILEFCKMLGIHATQMELLPDTGSAFLSILTSGGITFGVKVPSLAANNDFQLTETDASVTTVLCAPFQNSKPSAVLFAEFIASELEAEPND